MHNRTISDFITSVALSAVVLLCSFQASGQEYVRPDNEQVLPQTAGKIAISVSAGAGVPVREFGSTKVTGSFWDFNSPDSTRLQGFALTGFHFDFTMWLKINDFLGAELCYGGTSNPVNLPGFSNAVHFQASADETSYYTAEYMIGPYLYFKGNEKVSLRAFGMIGLVTNTYPTFTLVFSPTTTYSRSMDNGGSGTGFNLGMQGEYSLTKRLILFVRSSYMGVRINYPSWTETETVTTGNTVAFGSLHHSTDQTFMQTGIITGTMGLILQL